MRILLSFSLLLCSGACLAEESPARDSEFPVVTLYTQFEKAPSPTLLETLQKEVHGALHEVGVEFQWRSLDDPRASQPVAELVVVKFKGTCIATPALSGGRLVSGALGWTHMSDGELLPFTDIDCDRTWRLIQPELVGADAEDENREFGRALARVLAHELYHVFANTTKHARDGLAKSCYTAPDLLADSFHFTARELNMIRAGKLRHLLRRSAPMVIAGGGE